MSIFRTWRLAVLLAVGMAAAASADLEDEGRDRRPAKPYTLTLDALVGPSGTDVVVQVSATGGQALPAEAKHVLLRTRDSHGRVTWLHQVRHLPLVGGRGVIPNLPIPAHARLSAHLQVRAAGSHRVWVLSGNAVALYRPQLRIAQVSAPPEARTGQVVNVSVLVQETRGDLGATFGMLLSDGGTVIDQVSGATIQPLGSTTLAFALRFDTAGVHALEVAIVDSVPAEYSLSDNTATFMIQVSDVLPLRYTLNYQRIEGAFSNNFTLSETTTVNEPGSSQTQTVDQQSLYQEIGRHETLTYSGSSDRLLTGAIDFSATVRVDGTAQPSMTISGWLPFQSTATKTMIRNVYQTYDPDTGTRVYLESIWDAFKGISTVLQYNRTAGDYTYESSGYNYFWSSVSVTDPVTGTVTTTVQSNQSTTSNSGAVTTGVFLDAFQTVQFGTSLSSGATTMGGWTQDAAVQMSAVDRNWDQTTVDPGETLHTWGYEQRTYWTASDFGVTTP
jgi:hypothetical protein